MESTVLFDTEFIEKLIKENQRDIYVRISALNNDNYPIEQIQGKVQDGQINIDGKSIIRRTCSLTMVAEDIDIHSYYWGLKNKFTLEVGLVNRVNLKYPKIIWFKQGTFVITQFNTTQATNKWTIKIQGKDKMCLLNGDVSGNLPHETDFGKEEYHDLENDTVTYKYVPIKDIIRRIVQEFGGESPQNIIINDIEDAGLILLEYLNEAPAYLYKELNSNEYKNIIMDGNIECLYKLKQSITIDEYNLIPDKYIFLKNMYIKNDEENKFIFNEGLGTVEYRERLEDGWFKGSIGDAFNITYESLLENIEFLNEPTIIKFPYNKEINYTLAKIEHGDIPGYFLTDLTYAYGSNKSSQSDLIAKAGETLTSVLDKIKNMLVHFEYYYDIDGKFIFQKKKDYITTPWNNLDTNNLDYKVTYNSDNIMFSFVDGVLISSFQNSPKINNIKNDYSVWGSYNVSGTEIPIHMRYAIDNKPLSYKPIRPLKEEIHTIIEKDGIELSNTITYKYYDGPEVEPYSDEYLIKLTDFNQSINGFKASNVSVYTKEGYLKTVITYPYFAKNAYKTKNEYNISYKDGILSEEKNGEISLITLENLQKTFKEQNLFTNIDDYIKWVLTPKEYEDMCIKTIISYGVDWRELIYQMALDYRKCNYDDNFLYYIAQSNPQYPTGKTGYEQYYIDLEGFWRTLYDPNPQLQYVPINFNEVKKYTQLEKGLDSIYIEDGYRPIQFNDINSDLTPSDLYCLSTPVNGSKKMYPYIGSENCHLSFDSQYYINENDEMKSYLAQSPENDAGYTALNKVTLENIYTKNTQFFIVKHIDDNYNYYLSFDKENDKKEKLYKYFKVPMYPSSSKLDLYSNDYFKFVDIAFNQLLKENETLEGYYIKDKSPLKISEVYNENNNFYISNLIMFQQYAKNLQATLDLLDIKNYEDINKFSYLEEYLNEIQEYVLKMNQYNFQDLNYSICEELNLILKKSINFLLSEIEILKSQYNISEQLSCLSFILDNFKTNLINLRTLSTSLENRDSLTLLNLLKELYSIVHNTTIDINNNWIQTKYIINLSDSINQLENDENIISNLKQILLNYKQDLDLIPEANRYVNGQLQISIAQIDARLSSINSYNQEDINIFIEEQKAKIKELIVDPVNDLNTILKIIYEEDNSDAGIILQLTLKMYENFYLLLNCIQGLPQLLQERIFEKEEIYSIISFQRVDTYETIIILSGLDKLIKSVFDQNIVNKNLQNYLETTKDFQEYLIRNTVDNFNHISSQILQYEKIKYYRGTFNYNSDVTTGNFWSLNIYDAPHLLPFWFDFLNVEQNELSDISVPAIGNRTKVITDKNVQAINYKNVPQVIFKRVTDNNYEIKSGYTYININNNTESFFSTSSRAKSAKERVEELLQTHSYGAESITISAIPIYHLEPNHHILVRDDRSDIEGEYIVNKMTIPLNYKKTMNITATKAVSDIV